MNRLNGQLIVGMAHLQQSVADILGTPFGTRLERREYGSAIPDLIDAPDNALTRIQLYAAAASALMRWEPRLRLSRIQLLSGPEMGQAELCVEGEYLPTGGAVSVTAKIGRAAA